jgi:hypothetical protein
MVPRPDTQEMQMKVKSLVIAGLLALGAVATAVFAGDGERRHQILIPHSGDNLTLSPLPKDCDASS